MQRVSRANDRTCATITTRRTDATDTRGVNWPIVRAELKACREAARLSQVALARRVKTNKSTVNRIEDLEGKPDHTPDLETIERWVLATGLMLSAFFARIESRERHGT